VAEVGKINDPVESWRDEYGDRFSEGVDAALAALRGE